MPDARQAGRAQPESNIAERDAAAGMSVVVCTYSQARWDNLVSAIRSLQAQRSPFREIIVVVDHNPALLERVKKEFPGVRAIPNSFRKGLSGARNSGVAAASGAVVASIDDDARAEPDWARLIAETLLGENVAGVGSRVIPDWTDGKPDWFPDEFLWVVGCTYRGIPEQKQQIRNPLGAAMALRKDLIVKAGGYLSDLGRLNKLPLGCEETELCVRIRQKFRDTIFVQNPQAKVYHSVPAERAKWRYFCRRCFAEGLSKAAVSRTVGPSDALRAERAYVARVLPGGMARGMWAALRGDASGIGRAGAIAAGLSLTVAGYIAGSAGLGAKKATSPAESPGTWQPQSLAEPS